MLTLPLNDREFLNDEFERGFKHPATRAADSVLLFSSDSPRGFADVLDRLIGLLAIATPTWVSELLGRDPYEELPNKIVGAICAIANTPPRDRATRQDASNKLVLSVEPLISKYLALVEEEEHRTRLQKTKKPGLDTLVLRLRSLSLLPEFEVLRSEVFQSAEGWEHRDSFANALRDLIPGRLQAAHESSTVDDHVWKSAMAVMLTLAAKMPQGIAELLSSPRLPDRARAEISLPPSRFAVDGPPEGHRIPTTCPEPLTTRRNVTEHVVASARSRIDAAGSFLCFVEGPWGWGKSVFAKRVLMELQRPTLHIDMAGVATLGQFAEAALRQVPLAAAERRRIDVEPTYAFDLLADTLPHNAVIMLESVRCNAFSLSENDLTLVLRSVMSHGLGVFVECWAPLALPAIGVTQDRIIRITSHDLPAIDTDEVRHWAEAVCTRPLIDEETDSLRILGGNPLQLRLALERIRAFFPTAQPQALDEELLTFTNYIELEKAYREFLLQGHMDVTAPRPLGPRLCAAIACFPNHDLLADRGHDDTLRQLARIGLVTSRAGRWHTSSWLRLIALREFGTTDGPTEEEIRGAVESVDLSPDAEIAATRRHLLGLQARRPDALQAFADLSAALPLSIEDAQTVGSYAAPLDLTDISPAATPRPLQWLSLALWDACRTNNLEVCQTLAAEIHDASPSAVSDFLLSTSGEQATLFSAVPSLPDETALPLHRKIAGRVTTVMEPGPASLPAVRYLVDASDCALRMGETELGKEWRTDAKHGLERTQHGLDERNCELTYDVNVLGIRLANSGTERLIHHKKALDSIPSPGARDKASDNLWAIRSLEHTLPLLVASPDSFELLSRARSEFAIAGASAEWFSIWRKYRDAAESLPGPIVPIINEAVGGMARYLEYRKRAQPYRRLAEVFRSRSLTVDQAIKIVTQHASVSNSLPAGDDAILVDEALRSLMHFKTPPRGYAKHLGDAAQRILAALSCNVATTPETRRLRRTAFLYLIEHHLMTVRYTAAGLWNHGAHWGRHERFLSRLIWLTKQCGTPWAWSDGFAALFRLQAILLRDTHVSKRLQVLDLCNASRAQYVDVGTKTLDAHPAADLLRLRLARYIWDWPTAVTAARKVYPAQIPEPYAKDAEDAIYELVSAIVLIPVELRSWTPPVDDYADCSHMLVQILESRIAREGRKPRKAVLEFQLRLAENNCPPEAWEELVKTLELCIGSPKDYWRDIILKRPEAEDALEDLDDGDPGFDLTDMDWLFALGTVVRFGLADSSIDAAVRQRLGEYAVAITMDIMSWHRSLGIHNFLWKWHRGASIVYALLAAEGPSPILFEDTSSPELNRKGEQLSWVALAQRDLAAVANGPDTQFTRFVKEKGRLLLTKLHERGWDT